VASLQESLNELTTQIEDMSVTTKNLTLGIQNVSSTEPNNLLSCLKYLTNVVNFN